MTDFRSDPGSPTTCRICGHIASNRMMRLGVIDEVAWMRCCFCGCEWRESQFKADGAIRSDEIDKRKRVT